MSWSALGVIVGIISLSSGGLFFAVKFLMQRQAAELDKKFAELAQRDRGQDKRIESIARDLADHKLDAARAYLHRDDAVIFFGRAEQKIDAIWEFLHARFARGHE